jgi:uncharacterized membrane protein (UPF0127 family)
MAARQPGGARLRRLADDVVVCARVTEARSLWQRFRGLMLRSSLAPDEGLWLRDSSIHMMFMRFPIDALFLSRADASGGRRVVAIRHRLPPWTGLVLPVRDAEGVVELPAGTLARHGVAKGDVVALEARG